MEVLFLIIFIVVIFIVIANHGKYDDQVRTKRSDAASKYIDSSHLKTVTKTKSKEQRDAELDYIGRVGEETTEAKCYSHKVS